MTERCQELRILHRKAIYPGKFGGNLRSINIARLAMTAFEKTTLFSMDNTLDFEGTVEGIPVVQEKEFRNQWEKIWYYMSALTAQELYIPYTKKAFISHEHTLFQIEDPLLYPLLKKNKVADYILDEHNANWETYNFSIPDFKQRVYAQIAAQRDRENERKALLHASHVLCCSTRDRELLITEVPEIHERISVIPNCVNIWDYPRLNYNENGPNVSRKKGRVTFVGLMAYAPNVEAASLICEKIAPLIPNCEFNIVGKNPPKFPILENVRVLGYVEDLKTVIAESDICLAPIRVGSGTRIKILEYMAMGKPVISTTKGAEGIECTDGLNIILEDNIEKYPEIIRLLLDDDKKRIMLGREGRKLIENKYDWELYRRPLENIYRDTMGKNG